VPIYVYQCQRCKANAEVLHEMKYVGEEEKMPQELKDKISCNIKTCQNKKCSFRGKIWQRVPQLPAIVSDGTVTLQQKQQQKKTRSRAHFQNEIMPKITDKASKRHFEKKFKGVKPKDHTKM
jgi:predicted small metal-binding protein